MKEFNALGKIIKKGISFISDSVITLTNNERNNIMKVISSLANRELLLKRTTKKVISQEGGFCQFSQAINDGWFVNNKMCTYTTS